MTPAVTKSQQRTVPPEATTTSQACRTVVIEDRRLRCFVRGTDLGGGAGGGLVGGDAGEDGWAPGPAFAVSASGPQGSPCRTQAPFVRVRASRISQPAWPPRTSGYSRNTVHRVFCRREPLSWGVWGYRTWGRYSRMRRNQSR